MGVNINWDDTLTYTSIRYDFNGLWVWKQLAQANKEAFAMMREVPHEVNLIFDMTASLDFPIGALDAIRQMLVLSPPNLGIIVVTNADEVAEYTFTMLSNFDEHLSTKLVIAHTIDLARGVLGDYNAFRATG